MRTWRARSPLSPNTSPKSKRSCSSHERKLEADRAALAANQKERKKCEGDIQAQDQKISKLKDQMLQAKTNDQYRAFQNEIDFCQKEIRKAEDRILELMAESEPLDKNVKAAEAALKAEKTEVEKEKQQARERTAVDERSAAELNGERAQIVVGDRAGTLPAIRKSAQGAPRHRSGGGDRRPLQRVPDPDAAAVFPGTAERRPDSCPAKAASAFCTTTRR